MKTTIKYLFIIVFISANSQNWHDETRTYEYDNLNRLTKVFFNNGIVYEYQYDNLGNRLGKTIDVQLPQDNYNLSTVGLTCINSGDGIIHITAEKKITYKVQIVSSENNYDEIFYINVENDWELNIDYLEGGEYVIDITINGADESIYKKTFILNLDEPEPLEATSRLANNGNSFTVEMTTGTPPFTIAINDEVIATTNNTEYTFEANHNDVVTVTTSKLCEGVYSKTLSVLDGISLYPNPTNDKVFFTIPMIDNTSSIDIQLFDINSRLVYQGLPTIHNRQIEISIQHLPTGVYLAKFPTLGETTFKIIKE